MNFEWDEDKRNKNIQKHQVDFDIASYIFYDDYRLEFFDRIENGEEYYNTIGSVYGPILFVTFTYHNDSIRIVSARKAIKNERKKYNQNKY